MVLPRRSAVLPRRNAVLPRPSAVLPRRSVVLPRRNQSALFPSLISLMVSVDVNYHEEKKMQYYARAAGRNTSSTWRKCIPPASSPLGCLLPQSGSYIKVPCGESPQLSKAPSF